MMGNFSRHVASTPMNHNSSRSHCIFTIILQSKDKVKETYFTSKINLVDLAGSERTWKNKVKQTTLKESKKINLSLSYLE